MRRLRFGVTTLATFLLLAGWIVGQEKKVDKKPEGEPKKPEVEPEVKLKGTLPMYYKRLGLSEDQKQQVYRVKKSFREKAAALEKQIKLLKAEEKAAIEKVLTAAQRARLKEIRSGE